MADPEASDKRSRHRTGSVSHGLSVPLTPRFSRWSCSHVVPHPRAVSASRGPGLNRPAGPHHLGATGGQPAMSTDHLYGFGHIIVQSDRTDSGTADGTHMTAPWLDSRAPTTAGLTHEESESMAVAAASPTPIVSHDWRHKRQHPSSTSELSERAAPLDFCKLMCPNPYRRFVDTPHSGPLGVH